MSLTSRIQALTAYANEVTGKSDTTLSDAVASLADGYGGGSGSMPSSVSKIDGGTYTPSADTSTNSKRFTHSLGAVPKGFVVWTESPIKETSTTRYIVQMEFSKVDSVNSSADCMGIPTSKILYNGALAVTSNVRVTESNISNYVTASDFSYGNSAWYFKAGATYKWLAWA